MALELANFILELEKIDLCAHTFHKLLVSISWLARAVEYLDEAGVGASEGLTIMPSVERITLPMVASLSFPGRAFTMPAGMRINAMMAVIMSSTYLRLALASLKASKKLGQIALHVSRR